jgi:hypothetical protein
MNIIPAVPLDGNVILKTRLGRVNTLRWLAPGANPT